MHHKSARHLQHKLRDQALARANDWPVLREVKETTECKCGRGTHATNECHDSDTVIA